MDRPVQKADKNEAAEAAVDDEKLEETKAETKAAVEAAAAAATAAIGSIINNIAMSMVDGWIEIDRPVPLHCRYAPSVRSLANSQRRKEGRELLSAETLLQKSLQLLTSLPIASALRGAQ